MTGFMEFPFVEVLEIGGWCRDCTHAARRLTRFSGPGHYCSANHPKWSGWQELHLRPPRSEQGRLLLTLHPEKWLPDLDSHQDKRLNRPPCYFDTTWQMALPTGFTPASFRLEDGCLMYSTTAAIWKWSERQDFHLRPHGPKPGSLKTE